MLALRTTTALHPGGASTAGGSRIESAPPGGRPGRGLGATDEARPAQEGTSMRGRSVDTDGRARSRRVVAKGAGAGAVAAAFGALGLRTSVRPVAAQDDQDDQDDEEVLAAWAAGWSSGSSEGAAAV